MNSFFFAPSIVEAQVDSLFYLRFDPKKIYLSFFHLRSSSSLSKTFIPLRSCKFFATPVRLSFDLKSVGTILTVITCSVHIPRGLCCTWTCPHHRDLSFTHGLYRKQEQVPLLEVTTTKRPQLSMYVSTQRGLSCTWNVSPLQRLLLHLDWSGNRSLCWSLTYLLQRGLCCTLMCLNYWGLCGSSSCLHHSTGA